MERAIIFKGEMVKAILESKKSMTRRPVKPQPLALGVYRRPSGRSSFRGITPEGNIGEWESKCPYGVPGDRLWVRETWACKRTNELAPTSIYRADGIDRAESADGKWHSPRFMPKWASRITLEITNIRVERLQEVTVGGYLLQSDVKKEGCPIEGENCDMEQIGWFISLWDSIYGKGAWELNPWVWCISFRRLP